MPPFERLLAQLKNFVETDDYHDYLLKIIQNAAKRIGQKDLIIQVNCKR